MSRKEEQEISKKLNTRAKGMAGNFLKGLFFFITIPLFIYKKIGNKFICKKCHKKISFWEWANSVHSISERGYCEKCETIETRNWIKSQIKLIKSGRRLPPKIC